MKNWSVLVLACGLFGAVVPAPLQAEEIVSWNVQEGDLGEASNWKPETAPDLSSPARWEISNGGTATISAGQNYGLGQDLLIAMSNGSGSLVLNGDGALTVKRYLSIGHSGKGTGEVILNDTSSLVIENGYLLVGQRSTGSLSIAQGASVALQSGNLKIGEGQSGTVNLAGTLEIPALFFGSVEPLDSEQNSILNFEAGAKLKVAKAIVFNATGSHLVQINGSGGEFAAGSLKVGEGTSTFRFQVDSDGVTTVKIAGSLDISQAVLEVNLDGFSFKQPGQKLVLFECQSLAGKFASVTWLGKTKAAVKYDGKGVYLVQGK